MEEANKALKRQRQNIQELENEKTQMARSLKTSRSKQNKLKDEKNTDSVYQLIEGQDNLNVMIKREIAAGKDLSTEINRIERQIAQQRKTANQMGQPSGMKQIIIFLWILRFLMFIFFILTIIKIGNLEINLYTSY